MKKKDRWIVMHDKQDKFYGKEDEYYFTNLNGVVFKYDFLQLVYTLKCEIQWFLYYWRRRNGENITHCLAEVEIEIPVKEIDSYKVFEKLNEDNEEERIKKIEEMVNQDFNLKQAMIEKHIRNFTNKITEGAEINRRFYERFCDRNDIEDENGETKLNEIKKGNVIGESGDDFSGLKDLNKCIVNAY